MATERIEKIMEAMGTILIFTMAGVIGIAFIIFGCILKGKAKKNANYYPDEADENAAKESSSNSSGKIIKRKKAIGGIQNTAGQALLIIGIVLVVISICWFVFKWKGLF